MQTPAYYLQLAHINDCHSNFDPVALSLSVPHENTMVRVGCHSGGYGRIATLLEQARDTARRDNQAFLFLHGGDTFQGTLYFNEFKGRANAKLLNMLRPDAIVLGNHEIDSGNAPLHRFIEAIDFPMLAGNMDLSGEDPTKAFPLARLPNLYCLDPSTGCARVIKHPLGDRELAIVGITLDQMSVIARPDPDTHFANAVETCERTVKSLKAEGIDHILVLSHLGLDGDRKLAAAVEGISLIVGGHSHTLMGDFAELGLSAVPWGERVNGVPILHAGKYAETLGLAGISFDKNGQVTTLDGANYLMLDEHLVIDGGDEMTRSAIIAKLKAHPNVLWPVQHPHVQQVIETEFRPAIRALDHQVLAMVPRELVHTRLPSKALPHGSEVAPWVSRAMYEESRILDGAVQFALHNAGGVRQSLSRGQITLADVLGRLLPFELPLVKYAIEGQYLFEALESAINSATNNSVVGTGAGSFPYTFGLKYHYDGRRPMGERVLSLTVAQNGLWVPVRRQQVYVGVSSAYTASGKEGYDALACCHWQESIDGLTLPGAFIRFIQRHGEIADELAPQLSYVSHLG
ncbi:bifunctional UDP-sugar hydrolase/5'-nucleotidase [Shewanella sp. FJAT-52076]|uniref:bifunctional metallophosphatase/5'-nucleotidase n=1 Tax=Shewanella sp. FJAT-52076 TaxID=2864202 RepID=UPI001C655867|nr:bifunctional metallophosphatase/5'-nucleotidase [Shewanella sp. FJAT-52076]QYJ74175.1 bifunctional metallophosphatase/5'-nucleotidase [Shewanella sp. FJAT-52076]